MRKELEKAFYEQTSPEFREDMEACYNMPPEKFVDDLIKASSSKSFFKDDFTFYIKMINKIYHMFIISNGHIVYHKTMDVK